MPPLSNWINSPGATFRISREQRVGCRKDSELKIFSQRLLIEGNLQATVADQGSNLSRKNDFVLVPCIKQRAFSSAVAHQCKATAAWVPHRNGKGPDEPLRERFAKLEIQPWDHRDVRFLLHGAAPLREPPTQFMMIVNVAVADGYHTARRDPPSVD